MRMTDHGKPGWFFYLAWGVMSSISIPVALATYRIVSSLVVGAIGSTIQVGGQRHITEDFLLPIIFWPALGLVTGLLQYVLLRRYLLRIGWWIGTTTLGWSLGLIGNRLFSLALYGTLDVRAIWFETLMTALAGGVVGLAQWLVLHRRVRHAVFWLPANILGWGIVGWGAGILSNRMTIPIVGIMLIPGIATSIVLWLLLDRLAPHQGGGRNGPPNHALELTP